ncbi:GNAT family N-acetyltransferase [Nocardioides panaciterrulae]|uniref:Ribosomal protein S18 acetylase RimI-like enzyme n=1 Tax=Nocardioides panaciterrulae TaxID=661492 RepID=A0A7Y9JBE3_9ACTN|nr:GNAT family N-acetyltransferase [Nocardioides panaciterrulae]NYD42111.1 ribosomal protein S18 acetylase RimI-like enzyme [Nocardioides panaciterrulae]
MLVRPYERSDRALVVALGVHTEVRSVAELRLVDGRLGWSESTLPTPRTKSHDLAGYLDEAPPPWNDAFVAVRAGRVMGFTATALSGWNRRLVLLHMYVDAAARGQGVGTALLGAAIDSHRAAAARHVWLETQTDNVPAIRAYERMGFRLVGLDQTMYGDHPGADTAVFMSRPIVRRSTR